MDVLDNLSSLPEWDDEGFRKIEDEDGDEDLGNDLNYNACKALYNQWREVMAGINGLFSYAQQSADVPEIMLQGQKENVLSDAYQVAVKVRSSAGLDLYVLKMENAAIIRKNAMFIHTQIGGMAAMGFIEEDHALAVRRDIDKFRSLFIEWINTFEKDEFEDEWGFFV
jgi:hypothetical protein